MWYTYTGPGTAGPAGCCHRHPSPARWRAPEPTASYSPPLPRYRKDTNREIRAKPKKEGVTGDSLFSTDWGKVLTCGRHAACFQGFSHTLLTKQTTPHPTPLPTCTSQWITQSYKHINAFISQAWTLIQDIIIHTWHLHRDDTKILLW